MPGEDKPRAAAAIAAQSKDPKAKKGKTEDPDMAIKKDELSEDDQRIKNEVELLVQRTMDADFGLALTAVNMLGEMLRTATGTVASIPKPLKFVRPHFVPLRAHAETLPASAPHRAVLYDILSMIAMTLELPEKHVVINLKLKGSSTNIAQWGHEFLRHLCGDIGSLWATRKAASESVEDLANLVHQAVAFFMTHADEASAIDLAMEIGEAPRIIQYTDASNFNNVVQYLWSIAPYLPAPEDEAIISVAFDVCLKHAAYPAALRLALRSRDAAARVITVFESCSDGVVRKQLALVCARARHFTATGDESLDEIIGNNKLSELFRHSARDLDSMAVKTPDDVFKEKLSEATTSSHIQNLAALLANGFANCGFGEEALLKSDETWIYKTKDHRMMSATASLGLVHLWDADAGLSAVDKFAYSEDNYVKAGALLGTGIVLAGIRSPFDPAFSLLSEHVSGVNREMRIGAILGLAFAYAGTKNTDVQELLTPLVADSNQPFEVQCFAAYAVALVHVGTCNNDASEAVMMCLMEKTAQQLTEPCARYLVLALGLLFLGAQDRADTLLEATGALNPAISKYTKAVVVSCAYAGSGNVLMVQELFKMISSKDEEEDASKGGDAPTTAPPAEGAAPAAPPVAPLNFKAAAVMGVGAIALGEDLGGNMVKRSILHSLLSKEDAKACARRGVPLALALLSVSDPQMPVVENLVKLSHDSDVGTAQAATFAIGIVSAGSNNARVATSLRALTTYYARDKEHNHGFVVRIAQALLAMGKGHITLSPLFHDATTVSPVALAGVLTLCYSALDLQNTILDKYHYMIFAAAVSANPRMLLTVDPELQPLQTQVRVGQPVDTVTLPGKPKTITGFQQHNTPVLLSTGERAELVPGKYRALSAGLEGICILTEKAAAQDEDAA